jgi:hypothetical protein
LSVKFYIVVFDDGGGLCVPYGFDADCEGALCASYGDVALFTDRKQAQQAIRISTKYAELCKAQGLPGNTGFLGDSRKCVKIRRAVRSGD